MYACTLTSEDSSGRFFASTYSEGISARGNRKAARTALKGALICWTLSARQVKVLHRYKSNRRTDIYADLLCELCEFN